MEEAAGCTSTTAGEPSCDQSDCEFGAEVLAALRFAAWPVASSAAKCAATASRQSSPAKRALSPQPPAVHTNSSASSHDAFQESDVDFRPRKMRAVATYSGHTAPSALARRSYTWRGAARKAHQPADDSAAVSAAATAPTTLSPAAAVANVKEGDKEWAALTTWLRMNIHHPRTAKKVVMFCGTRDPSTSRWSFSLNPSLCWADLSADTQLRLAGLLEEASSAFARKYPSRPADHWRLKSQKYKPPGQGTTYQVTLGDLVSSLHAVSQRCLAEEEAAGAAAGGNAPGSTGLAASQQLVASPEAGVSSGGSALLPVALTAAPVAAYSHGSSEQTTHAIDADHLSD